MNSSMGLMVKLTWEFDESNLKIYFINLDRSIERRVKFEEEIAHLPFHLLSTLSFDRVPAIDRSYVKTMLAQGNLKLDGIETGHEIDQISKRYSEPEVACTLSHLKAILKAYKDGFESALIVEDDAVLTAKFLENWKAYSYFAPEDWTVLQWTTNNAFVNQKESHRSNDFWISWTGHHWSTIAYTINREGMERVLNLSSNIFFKTNRESLQWRFDEPGMTVSDELIYFLAGSTYTSSHCWVTSRRFPSTINDDRHQALVDFGQSKYVPTAHKIGKVSRSESIVVIVCMRLRRADEIESEFRSLETDILVLQRFNPQTQWFVKVVMTSLDLFNIYKESGLRLSRSNVMFQLQISNEPFNKFLFVSEILDMVSHFDYLLLKDNDIRLAGFEWNTFLNKKNNSIISAPFLIGPEGLTDRQKKKMQAAKTNNKYAVGLQDATLFNCYHSKKFQHSETMSAMALEMFMVLMRSDFAIWFFRQILSSDFISQDVDWGPDLMWCAAASDFQESDPSSVTEQSFPCCLISLNVKHVDTKQITKSKEHVALGNRVIKHFREKADTKHWIEMNSGSRVFYHHLLDWCLKKTKKRVGNGCLEDLHRNKRMKYFKSFPVSQKRK